MNEINKKYGCSSLPCDLAIKNKIPETILNNKSGNPNYSK